MRDHAEASVAWLCGGFAAGRVESVHSPRYIPEHMFDRPETTGS
jgi:hypothetical protein